MRVVMCARISGTRNGDEWPAIGGEVDVPDAEAVDLLNAGLAVAAESAPVEKATAKPTETATAPRRRRA